MKYLFLILLMFPAILKADYNTNNTIDLVITVLAKEDNRPLKDAFVKIKLKHPTTKDGKSTDELFDEFTNDNGKVEFLSKNGRGIPKEFAEKNEIMVTVEHLQYMEKWVDLGSDILISTVSPIEYTIWIEKIYGTDMLLQNVIVDPGKQVQNNKNVNKILRITESEYFSNFPSGDIKTEIKVITPPPKGLMFGTTITIELDAKAKNLNWGTRIFMFWGSTNIIENQKKYFEPTEVYIGKDPSSGTIITSRGIKFDVSVPFELKGQEATLWIYLQEGSASSIAWLGYNYK